MLFLIKCIYYVYTYVYMYTYTCVRYVFVICVYVPYTTAPFPISTVVLLATGNGEL